MSSINLLPPQLREDQEYAERNRKLVGFMRIIGVAIVIAVVVLLVQEQLLQSLVNGVNRQLSTAKAQMNNLSPVEAQSTQIQSRLNSYEVIRKAQTDWASLLRAIAGVASPGIYVTAVTADNTGTPIQIDGAARDRTSIAALMKSMTASGLFSTVDLTSTNPDFDEANFSKYTFSLKATRVKK